MGERGQKGKKANTCVREKRKSKRARDSERWWEERRASYAHTAT